MAQHDYDINSSDSISGLQVRQDINACLSAIKSSNSGVTAPTNPVAGMVWYDTSTNPGFLKVRNQANTAWDVHYLEDILGASIASGATTTIGVQQSGDTIHITGVTTITSFGVSTTGTKRTLIFDGVLTVTHNATSLILPGGENIVTVAGAIMDVVCEDGATGKWRCVGLQHPDISFAELGALNNLSATLALKVSKDSDTGSMRVPSGTTAQRTATPSFGDQRANSETGAMEWWNGTAWTAMGGGATGGGNDKIFHLNGKTVTTNYTIPVNSNAGVFGPLTIADGVTVTVSDGSTLTVV